MNRHMNARSLNSSWRLALLLLLALWLTTGWQHRETLLAMTAIWDRSATFTHAWLVPPIALWLMWTRRGQALAHVPAPSLLALVLMAVVGMVWLSGAMVVVATTSQFALVALFVLAVPALLGWSVAAVWAFPLGFLFFCVPIGEFMSPTLMVWTADFTVKALRLTGIPIYQEGLQFVIPSGRWSVVEACSGIRYLIASIMTGTLFAYLNYNGMRKRLVFIGMAIIVPLLANWARAYLIVMLAHLTDNRLAVGGDHIVYGWAFFGVVMLIFFVVGARWAEPAVDDRKFEPAIGRWPAPKGVFTTVAAAVVIAVPLQIWHAMESSVSQVPVSLVLPESLPGGWQRTADPAPEWKPGFINPVASQRAAYRSADGSVVGVYLAYYRGQARDSKLVSTSNRMVHSGDDGWQLVTQAERMVNLAAGPFEVREGYVLQPDIPGRLRQHLRMWQTYWIDGAPVASDIEGKFKAFWGRLMGRGDEAGVILVYTDQPANADDTRLAGFWSQAMPALSAALDAPRKATGSK